MSFWFRITKTGAHKNLGARKRTHFTGWLSTAMESATETTRHGGFVFPASRSDYTLGADRRGRAPRRAHGRTAGDCAVDVSDQEPVVANELWIKMNNVTCSLQFGC